MGYFTFLRFRLDVKENTTQISLNANELAIKEVSITYKEYKTNEYLPF